MNKKISDGLKRYYSTHHRWNKNIPHSKEQRENISKGLKKYYTNNSVWNKGKKATEETKKKLRGRTAWNKGTKGLMPTPASALSNEVKEKIRKSQMGKKNSNWRDGATSESKRIKGSSKWKNWRIQVFQRDNFTCQECGSKKPIEPHHIKSFSIYVESRFDVDNGVTLCKKCHRKTDNYGSRLLRKRGELGGHPERTIPNQA